MSSNSGKMDSHYIGIKRLLCSPLWLPPKRLTYIVMPAVMHTLKFKEQTVPPEIMKKASSLTGSAFLRYILYEVNEEHREALMLHEKFRLETFHFRWPYQIGSLTGNKMAATGFYAVNDSDRVRCVFCRGSLHRWEQDEDPAEEHAKAFPFCPFILRHECGNVPLQLLESQNKSMMESPKYPEYREYSVRLVTFSCYPYTSTITAVKLCEAGFFFRGGDCGVRCYWCGVVMDCQHIEESSMDKHSANCAHFNQMSERELTYSGTNLNREITSEGESARQLGQPREDKIAEVAQHVINEMSRQLSELPVDDNKSASNGNSSKDFDGLNVALQCLEQRTGEQDVDTSDFQSITLSKKLGNVQNVSHRNLFAAAVQGKILHCLNTEAHHNSGEVAANHVGLPCGHLIFCEECNKQVVQRKENEHDYQPLCIKCGQKIVGTLRVYFS